MKHLAPRPFTLEEVFDEEVFDEIVPVRSMDLSLVSSEGVTDDFSAIFSQPSDDDHGDLNHSMTTACEVVHAILDQVSWNDCPPGNESISREGERLKISRQCHVMPPSAKQLNILHPTEEKLGNVALANLCTKTLEMVGKSGVPTQKVESEVSSRALVKARVAATGKKRNWIKVRNPKENPSRFAEIVPSSQNHSSRKREAIAFGSQTEREEQENEAPTSYALQMFGSDYARHLSNTPLAPRDLPASRKTFIPRHVLHSKKDSGVLRNIEDADFSVLSGPITDIIITVGEDCPPNGYYRVSQSAGGGEFFFNDIKSPHFINVKKETSWDRAAQRPCVTALILIFPQRQEFVPPGFSFVRIYSDAQKSTIESPANVNVGGDHAFLCFRRSREGNPITAILPLISSKRESVPEGFTVVEKTPRNHVAVIQTQFSQVFLAYRQRLANLEPLRPLPLVMAARSTPSSSRRLDSYYSTGGTIVASRVGRFHIMDRSTHSLVSPRSVNNRLSLIEASRRKSRALLSSDAGESYAYSGSASSNSSAAPSEILASSLLHSQGRGTPSNMSLASHATDVESELSADVHGILSISAYDTQRTRSPAMNSISSGKGRFTPNASNASPRDGDVDGRLEALSFIPVVSTAIETDDSMAMTRFRARVAVLTPILTACYTRHGGSAQIAIDGLLKLVNLGFFSTDVNLEKEAYSCITLLDISIQVVCDVATTGSQETQMHSCVEFVQSAVRFGCGHLNTRTVGYVLRFYLFVFHFGMTLPSSGTGAWGTLNGRDHFLLEEPQNLLIPYLPGGAPQASILALKELISLSITRLQSLVASEGMLFRFKKSLAKSTGPASDLLNRMLGELAGSSVDRSVRRVDAANYTELASDQIKRSGGSELFWHDMIHSCGAGLFGVDETLRTETRSMFSILFAIMAHCVKVASTSIRKDMDYEGIPRDVTSKLVNLEMLHFFLREWNGMKYKENDIPDSTSFSGFLFAIRRLVVPCLLQNTAAAIEDPRVYRRVLRIINLLWTSSMYRKHLKLEIGILVDQFVVRFFKLGPQILFQEQPKENEAITYLFAQQIELSRTLLWWCSDPRGVLELFTNFGVDAEESVYGGVSPNELLSVRRWKIAQNICAALCDVTERCGDFIARRIRDSNAMVGSHSGEDIEVLEGMSDTTLARESAKRLRIASLGVVERIIRSVAEAAAASKGPKYNAIVDGWGTRPKGPVDLPQSFSEESDEDVTQSRRTTEKDGTVLGFWREVIDSNGVRNVETITNMTESDENKIDHVGIAFDIARDKGLGKAIDYLTICGTLTDSPRDIASFLRLHRSEIDTAALGTYLCQSGLDVADSDYWNLIRFYYIRPISFVGMTVDQGLRHLLSNGGFRLPGEAQQIDRLLIAFAQCYWEDNAGDHVRCPLKDHETVFVVSFAIIMLNTDLHKSPAKGKGKNNSRKKMSKSEFINNLKGTTTKADDLSPLYLSSIYDSIHASPICVDDCLELSDPKRDKTKVESDLESLSNNAKDLDALLRALSTREYRFLSIEDYGLKTLMCDDLRDATEFLTRQMFSQTWHQFHGLINTAVDIAHIDLEGMISCTSILKYALALTICLDMPLERSAFLVQLGRIRAFLEIRRVEGENVSAECVTPTTYKSEDWYTGIEEACTWNPNNPYMDRNRLTALKLIDELILDMMVDCTPMQTGRKETEDAVRCLANAEYLLNDPTRKLVRTSNLLKRSHRSGRFVEYRFFLFSDVLIYAKKIPHASSYKIHEELPLLLMKVVDFSTPNLTKESKRGIQIYHPRKNIVILCASQEERGSWVSSIRTAIAQEVARQVSLQTARKAAAATLRK